MIDKTCIICQEEYDVSSNSFFWTSVEKDEGWPEDGQVCYECYNIIKENERLLEKLRSSRHSPPATE